MSNIPADWIATAVKITPGFEVAGDPYLGVTGDFDGEGISCGALQWNIGQNSLQPMVRAVGEPVVRGAMPTKSGEMWNACNSSVQNGLAIVRGWQSNKKLLPVPKAELRGLMGTPAMRTQQDSRIAAVAETAHRLAASWAPHMGSTKPTKRMFCWFFDVVTQNGGMKSVTPQSVAAFIDQHGTPKADDVICDALDQVPGNNGHAVDARKNAGIWRNQASGEKLWLLCMSHLRAGLSKKQWRHVVMNRKGTIAMGKGRVNSSLWDFSALGL